MAPTRIYVKSILELVRQVPVHALSHITGGGLLENLPRVMPDHTQAHIKADAFAMPPVFRWLQEAGNVKQNEMYRTFNCGIGMVVVVPEASAAKATSLLESLGETVYTLGRIETSEQAVPAVLID